jgi:hypothetical protein
MAGTAPPVMLMICWLVCGPSVKRGERHRNGNPLLQNKIGTQQQKENQKKSDVHQRHEHKPAEVVINCALEFHEDDKPFRVKDVTKLKG